MAELFEIPMKRIDEMFEYVNAYSELIRKINVLMYEWKLMVIREWSDRKW